MPPAEAHSAWMLVAGPSELMRHYSVFDSPALARGEFAIFLAKWTVP